MSEYDRWEGRYAVPEYAFGKEPNYFLASCKALLPSSGRALAVADGEGRKRKWAGMRRALRPGGFLIIHGYTPKQLDYGTGGPKQIENLYTRAMLEAAFKDFTDMRIVEEEREIHEGASHGGMSAVIGLTARKPSAAE